MNKQEFFAELEECLQGEVSDREFAESIAYYRDYFRDQEAAGRSDEEILTELGGARYIARSIIDAHGLEEEAAHESGTGRRDAYEEYARRDTVFGDTFDRTHEEIVGEPESGPVDHALGQLGRILVLIAVLLLVGMVVRILLPVILIVIAAVMIMNLFRNMR